MLTTMLFVTSILVDAQANNDRQQGLPPFYNEKQLEKVVSHISKELSLNETQQLQISELFLEHSEDLKKLTKNDRNDFHTMENIKLEFESSILELLSNEQKIGFKTLLNSKPPKRGHKSQEIE